MSEVVVASTSGPPSGVSGVSSEQLDTLVRVTTVHGWLYLATLFAVCAAAVIFAVLYHVPIKVNGDGILLIEQDTLSQVRAQATGRLVALRVKLGDQVVPGEPIGEISQDDLNYALEEAQSRLGDLERENRELTQFEDNERETKDAAVARVKQAILQAQGSGRDKLTIAQRMVESADRLRTQHHLGDAELLEAHEKLYTIRDDLNKGESRLAELSLEKITAENARKKAQLERRLKIKQLVKKIALDCEKLARTSRVVSRVRGQVAQVLCAPGGLVHEGAPVVLLHASKSERGTDDTVPLYESIVFVPAGEGKKIGLGNAVEVTPATVKREEYGFIRGHVVAVSELPATKLAMEAALEHPELVDSFLKRYAPGVVLRVHVKLEEEGVSQPASAHAPGSVASTHFRWSTSSGRAVPLKTGTMCQAAIVVDKRRLISLILPWTKKAVGAD
jgi:HlyD family secretion protein